jgi:anti-sigma regulatory factor (Ser/Thr protein kinase)
MPSTRTRSFHARRGQWPDVLTFVESAVEGMDDRLATKLRLAIEELFLNTLTHGHGGDTDAPVEVTVGVDGDRVVLIYVDAAPPFDPFAAVESPDPAASLEARSVGRLGVFLITALAARCDYARTGDRNRITVELRGA